MSISDLIKAGNNILLNRALIKQIGLNEAVILGELSDEYDYWKANKLLTKDGFFFSTVENIQERTSLSEWQQATAINNLKKAGLISVKRIGIPPKRHFKINEEKLQLLLLKGRIPNSAKTKDTYAEKTGTNEPKERIYYNYPLILPPEGATSVLSTPIYLLSGEQKEAAFKAFWEIYPRKTYREATRKRFNHIGVSYKDLVESVNKHIEHESWDDPQYIPHPVSYIKGERWNDALDD